MKKSWWVDFRWNGTRVRKRSPLNTRAGAQQYEATLRKRLADGDDRGVDTKGPVPEHFAAATRQWFLTHVKTNTRASVQKGYEGLFRVHLLPRFGSRRLESLTGYDIEQLKAAKLQSGLSAQSINHQLAALRSLLRTCRDWGWLRHVPVVRLLKVPPHQFDFFTPTESERLIEGARGTGWDDMILCALRTGMRAGELRGLRWEDIDLERGVIAVRRSIVCGEESAPKNNRVRHIPMSGDLIEALKARERSARLVFVGHVPGPLTTSAMRRGLERACRRGRLRVVGWHTLRHTFASQLAGEGGSVQAIQALLGHSSIQMTMRYTHLTTSTLRDTVGLLARAVERGGQPLGQPAVNRAGQEAWGTLVGSA